MTSFWLYPSVGLNGQPIIEIWHGHTAVLIRIENVYVVTAQTTGNAALQRNTRGKKAFASFDSRRADAPSSKCQ